MSKRHWSTRTSPTTTGTKPSSASALSSFPNSSAAPELPGCSCLAPKLIRGRKMRQCGAETAPQMRRGPRPTQEPGGQCSRRGLVCDWGGCDTMGVNRVVGDSDPCNRGGNTGARGQNCLCVRVVSTRRRRRRPSSAPFSIHSTILATLIVSPCAAALTLYRCLPDGHRGRQRVRCALVS